MSFLRTALCVALAVPSVALATVGASDAGLGGGYTVGAGVTRAGVTVYPVIASGSAKLMEDDQILPFADALLQGALTVTEAGHNMEVASLRVHNRGKHAVLVMAGEIVEGGQQDRVITQDLLLQPSDEPVIVQVNCVERGRWSGGSGFAYGGRAELGLRRVVQVRRNQDATWEAVASVNQGKGGMLNALGYDSYAMAPSTGTYMASMRSGVLERQVAKAAGELSEEISKEGNVVGVVVAVGGNIVGTEVYGYPEVWDQVRDTTLAAAARDGMTQQTYGTWTTAPTQQVAASFLQSAVGGEAVEVTTRGLATHTTMHSEDALSYVLADADGELLHLASYRREGSSGHF